MNCFFLNIASHNGLLACVSENEVIALREVTARIRDHELIPLVEELLKEAGWKYDDLTHVACVIGPGGFTSLRVAVSFANTLMDQLGILGSGIHLSELYFERCNNESNALWLHASKRDSLFVRDFGEHQKLWREPTYVSSDEFIEKAPSGFLWMGELLGEQKEELIPLGLKEAPLTSVKEILPEFLSKLDYNKKLLAPWYGRTG